MELTLGFSVAGTLSLIRGAQLLVWLIGKVGAKRSPTGKDFLFGWISGS